MSTAERAAARAWTPTAVAGTALGPAVPLETTALVARFVEAVARSKFVVAVGDGRRLAHMPSPHETGVPLFLLWSHAHEASRWADVLASSPQVIEIDLPTLLLETLPAIGAAGGRIGPDWSAEPIEPEITPDDLDRRLRAGLVEDFVATVTTSRVVWVLQEGDDVAGLLPAGPGAETIPVWSDRHLAERVARRMGTTAEVRRLPLAELTGRLLMSARGLKAAIAPGYVPGAAARRLTAWEFKGLLATAGRTGAPRQA
jgi:hypothetical protein